MAGVRARATQLPPLLLLLGGLLQPSLQQRSSEPAHQRPQRWQRAGGRGGDGWQRDTEARPSDGCGKDPPKEDPENLGCATLGHSTARNGFEGVL